MVLLGVLSQRICSLSRFNCSDLRLVLLCLSGRPIRKSAGSLPGARDPGRDHASRCRPGGSSSGPARRPAGAGCPDASSPTARMPG